MKAPLDLGIFFILGGFMNRLKGMFDIIEDQPYYEHIEQTIKKITHRHHILKMDTPLLENTSLFHRGMGDLTDVVQKETYSFKDRGDREITLRPEGTAGVVRAFIEHKLYASSKKTQKFYYYGPMFRYERPQKGRFRQFMSFGVEAFGERSALLDVDIIASAYGLMTMLKIPSTVYINSLPVSLKNDYKAALKDQIKPHLNDLCEDCQKRYEDNPLRMLDCKVDKDHPSFKKAPSVLDFLNEEEKVHFETLKEGLNALKIPFTIDPFLVRGLDYYTETVFEIKADEAILGAQNTVCGGGRYDHLVSDLEGPSTAAVGYAFGIERLILALKHSEKEVPSNRLNVYAMILGDQERIQALSYIEQIRNAGLSVESTFEVTPLKGQFKQVMHHQALFTLVFGSEELKKEIFTVKNQDDETTHTGTINSCISFMKETIHGQSSL